MPGSTDATMKGVYRITYPNGKIYVGMDVTGSINYFGSADSKLVAADFPPEARRDFTARKEILWESETAFDAEVRAKEAEFITSLKSNDPAIGYDRWPKFIRPRKVHPADDPRWQMACVFQVMVLGGKRYEPNEPHLSTVGSLWYFSCWIRRNGTGVR